MITSHDVRCGDCRGPMALRESPKIVDAHGKPRLFYGCMLFPQCTGIHGAHPDGSPMGIPADKDTRAARVRAHEAFDGLRKARKWARRGSYVWLARKMEMEFNDCHVAMFDIPQCEAVVRICDHAARDDRERNQFHATLTGEEAQR